MAVEGEGARPRRRLLVADGDADAADSLAWLLRHFGWETHIAYTGPAALELARSQAVDIVLTDLRLPGKDGFQLAQELAGQAVLIAITGLGQEAHRQRAREVGFAHYLLKPVDIDHLRTLLMSFEES